MQKSILKKLPGMALAIISVDSWRKAEINRKNHIIEQEYQSKIDQLTFTNYNNEIASMNQKTKYEALAERIQESKDRYNELSAKFQKVGTNQENKTDLLQSMKQTLDNKVNISNKISNELNDITQDFGNIQQLLDNYREYISHLDPDQIGCLANGIAFIIIISTVNSIAITYYGTVIINWFNLENKYSKLSEW